MSEYDDPEPGPEPDLETVAPGWSDAPTLTEPTAATGSPVPPPGARPPAGPPPAGRGPLPALVAAAAVVALVVGFATATLVLDSRDSNATSSATDPTAGPATTVPSGAPGTSTPATGTPGTTAPAKPSDPDEQVLPGLIVKQTDVPAAATVHHLTHGADLTVGTLDLCNGTFATEKSRTARRQVDLTDANGTLRFSTEAVLYGAAAVGAQALDELRSVVAHCPDSPVKSPIGEPAATTKFRAAPDGSWPRTPTVDRLAYDFVATDTTGDAPSHSMAVYLRRGRVLMGLYFATPDVAQVPIAGRSTIPTIVAFFEGRIASLPASVVNR